MLINIPKYIKNNYPILTKHLININKEQNKIIKKEKLQIELIIIDKLIDNKLNDYYLYNKYLKENNKDLAINIGFLSKIYFNIENELKK